MILLSGGGMGWRREGSGSLATGGAAGFVLAAAVVDNLMERAVLLDDPAFVDDLIAIPTDDAVPPGRRAFTLQELQRLFDRLDDLVDREHAAGSKRWLPAYRDSIAFKLCYAYGLRRRELTMLDVHDFIWTTMRASAIEHL